MFFALLSCQPDKVDGPFLPHEAAYLSSLVPMEVHLDETNRLSGLAEAETFGELLFFEHDI